MIGTLLVTAVALVLVRIIRRDRIRQRLRIDRRTLGRLRLAHERQALAGLGIGFAVRGVSGAWLGLAGGAVFAEVQRRREATSRVRRIEAQVPELVRGLIANLRVGGSIPDAIASVAEDLPHPIAEPIRSFAHRLATGTSMPAALTALRAEVPCRSIERLTDAIATAVEVGGSLEELLGFIGEGIRDRLQLERERRAGTTQGRLSAIVVGGMPVAFLAITGLGASSPGRILLTEPVGWMLLAVGMTLEAAGFLWVRRIVRA